MAKKPTTTPVEPKPAKPLVAANADSVEAVTKAGQDMVAKSYEKTVELTTAQVEKASTTAFKTYDDMAVLGKETFEAYIQSGTVIAQGIESMNKELLAFARDAFESNVKTTQALFGAKTLREAIDVQSQYSRASLDSVLSETAKLTEMSVQMTNQAMQPIQARVNLAVEKFMKPLAA